jgi:hypothetical protein
VIIVLAAGLPRRAFLEQRSRRGLSKTVEQVEHDNGSDLKLFGFFFTVIGTRFLREERVVIGCVVDPAC